MLASLMMSTVLARSIFVTMYAIAAAETATVPTGRSQRFIG